MAIKQTFRYRDPRETRLLNQASKDQFGRQRNHVLYGFDWGPSGTNRNQILLGRGAIYTQDGVKIFFDETAILSAIVPSQGLTNGDQTQFPFPKNIIVGIQHNYVASTTAQDAKLVMIEVRTVQGDQEPAYYLKEINTITLVPMSDELVDPDRKAYNGTYDMNVGGGSPATVTNIALHKSDNSIPENVTPILKIRIQQIHSGGSAVAPDYLFTSGGALTDGVEIVRYKNVWQQTNDLIGLNLFEPLIKVDQRAIGDLRYPSDSRQSQDFVLNESAGGSLPTNEKGTPTQHPLFGSFDPNGPTNYASYRFASFLMDGRSILEGMKRLDAWIRLLVNRTGEQSLVDLTDSLTELQDIVDQGTTGDPIVYGSNFMLKDGNIHHLGASNTGDSHRRALHFLDNCVHYICNRLGMTPIMTRGEIESDSLTATELWNVSNPPGLDITSNMTFHAALQTLRDYFTSRGNEVITGRHVYSLTATDRDLSGGDPVGQKTIISKDEVTVTDDTVYLKISKGSIDSSNTRSDKIAGTEVATLDSSSRYSFDKLKSHDSTRISSGQGPLIEGVINAPQGDPQIGALENIIHYNPKWSVDQLQAWAGNNTVTFGTNGGLLLAGGIGDVNGIYPGSFIPCKPASISYALSVISLSMPSAGPFIVKIKFYDAAFSNAAFSTKDISLANITTNGTFNFNNSLVNGSTDGVDKPSAAVYMKVFIVYNGSGSAEFGIRFGGNRIPTPVFSDTATTGLPGDALARKDYIDAADALKVNKTDIAVDGSTYYDAGHTVVGTSLKITISGIDYFVPSNLSGGGPCHTNCHSNCHGNCHTNNCNIFAV